VITAYQSGRLETAKHLKSARDELAQTMSSGCWVNKEHEKISVLITEIDKLFSQLIPNKVD
jgi:hypothetical protein